MFWEVTNRRKDEKTISYAESHDQALVGDKTIRKINPFRMTEFVAHEVKVTTIDST